MLARPFRLRTERDYQRVFRSSRPLRGKYFTVRAMPTRLPTPRYGFVVGGKTSKSSVIRNKLKRQMRAVAAPMLADLPALDIVVIAEKPAVGQEFTTLANELHSLIPKAIHAASRHRYHRPVSGHPVPRP